MRGDRPRPGVVVVNYLSHSLLVDALDAPSLAAAGVQVFVVDNRSTDAEREAIGNVCGERGWILVETSANRGFGAGVNRGVEVARLAGLDTFITVNPDARVSTPVLLELCRAAHASPRSLIGPAMVDSTGADHFRGSLVSMRSGAISSGWEAGDGDAEWKNWLSGACLAFSAEAFNALEGFDESYFLYWEDVDLSRRAVRAGVTLRLRTDLEVVHDEGGTHGVQRARAKSAIYYRYNTRNRLRFAVRHCSRRQLWGWIVATPRQSARIWLRGGRRQILDSPSGLLAALVGTLEGLGPAVLAGLGVARRHRA